MKRFLITLLVLCTLAVPAFGENIAQRIEAPENVSLPATVSGIKSSLAVDAKVVVPAVERVPILQVQIDKITEESIFAAADAMGLTDIDRSPSAWSDDVFEDGGSTKGYTGYPSGLRQFYSWAGYKSKTAPEAVTFANLYSNEFKTAEYFVGQIAAKPYPAIQREGTMTREAALALAEKTMQAFTKPYAFTLEVDGALGGYAQLTDPEITAINAGTKSIDSVRKYPYAFSFHFAPLFEGIPLTQHDNPHPWQSKADAEALVKAGLAVSEAVDSRLQIVVLDEGVQGLEWSNPLSVVATLKEDSELLPFTEILDKGMEALKQYCIKADEFFETDGSFRNVTVTEIRFGYLCQQAEPDSMDLRLVPVWDFMVNQEYCNSGEARMDNHYGQAIITINAEDGSVMTRFSE